MTVGPWRLSSHLCRLQPACARRTGIFIYNTNERCVPVSPRTDKGRFLLQARPTAIKSLGPLHLFTGSSPSCSITSYLANQVIKTTEKVGRERRGMILQRRNKAPLPLLFSWFNWTDYHFFFFFFYSSSNRLLLWTWVIKTKPKRTSLRLGRLLESITQRIVS